MMIFQVEADYGEHTCIVTEDIVEALKSINMSLSNGTSGVQLIVWNFNKEVYRSKMYTIDGEDNLEEIYKLCNFIRDYNEPKTKTKESTAEQTNKYLVVYDTSSKFSRMTVITNIAVIHADSEEKAKEIFMKQSTHGINVSECIHVYELEDLYNNWFYFV